MASVKASQQGSIQIKQAMARQGWKWDSDRPLIEASKILEPDREWDNPRSYARGCSQNWKRFLQRIPIRCQPFNAFCQALGIDADEVAHSDLKEDWGEAPNAPKRIGTSNQSYLLLTSRVKPKIEQVEKVHPAQTLELDRLNTAAR